MPAARAARLHCIFHNKETSLPFLVAAEEMQIFSRVLLLKQAKMNSAAANEKLPLNKV